MLFLSTMNAAKNIFLAMAFAFVAPFAIVAANDATTDSLLHRLDEIIANKSTFEERKRASIERHLYRLRNAADLAVLQAEYSSLFNRYRKYKLDSALYYARMKLEVARKIGIPDSINLAMMNEADGLKGLGRFNEGQEILNSIPKTDFVRNSAYFYYLRHSIVHSLAAEAIDEEEHRAYAAQLRLCRDSIAMVNPENSIGNIVNRAEIMKMEGNFHEACALLENASSHPDAAENAIFWASLANTYNFLNRHDDEKLCLTRAAIIDKRSCVKTYTSLQDLAILLYRDGDIDRAYKYITCALEDIIESNARSRLIQVAEYMPIITEAYKVKRQEERQRNIVYYVIFIVMTLILIVLTTLLIFRNRKLSEARVELDARNASLVSLNEQLSALNDDLNSVNNRLSDSNKIKEEYIAQLFDICSGYIDEIERYRISLVRKVKAGQHAELLDVLNEPIAASSLKDFFRKFDMIFLDLFPTFIDEFNKLLQPGAQIVPKEGELLTPELRIYALVRLGINDSTRIAGFLHYSSQTVYNYRLRTRNKAIVPKDRFVESVQNLC